MTLQGSTTADGPGLLTEQQAKQLTDRVLAIKGSRVEHLLKDSDDDSALIDKLYLATVARRPTEPERGVALRELAKDRRRGAENLQWALINSPEFLFNY